MDFLYDLLLDSFLTPVIFILIICVPIGALLFGSAVSKAKNFAKRRTKTIEKISAELEQNEFSISQQLEFISFFKYNDYSINFFVDDENKRIAIASYQKMDVTFFKFSELVKVEIFQNSKFLGNTISDNDNSNYANLKLVLHTKNVNTPVYTIELSHSEITNSKSKFSQTPISFAREMTSLINNIIE